MAKGFKDQDKSTESQYGAIIGNLNNAETETEYDSKATQGKAGKKLDRMNMGFSKENYEYLRIMAGIHQVSITKYVNHIIEQDRKNNADLYIKARDLTKEL